MAGALRVAHRARGAGPVLRAGRRRGGPRQRTLRLAVLGAGAQRGGLARRRGTSVGSSGADLAAALRRGVPRGAGGQRRRHRGAQRQRHQGEHRTRERPRHLDQPGHRRRGGVQCRGDRLRAGDGRHREPAPAAGLQRRADGGHRQRPRPRRPVLHRAPSDAGRLRRAARGPGSVPGAPDHAGRGRRAPDRAVPRGPVVGRGPPRRGARGCRWHGS